MEKVMKYFKLFVLAWLSNILVQISAAQPSARGHYFAREGFF
jgi:hypothetical protein